MEINFRGPLETENFSSASQKGLFSMNWNSVRDQLGVSWSKYNLPAPSCSYRLRLNTKGTHSLLSLGSNSLPSRAGVQDVTHQTHMWVLGPVNKRDTNYKNGDNLVLCSSEKPTSWQSLNLVPAYLPSRVWGLRSLEHKCCFLHRPWNTTQIGVSYLYTSIPVQKHLH